MIFPRVGFFALLFHMFFLCFLFLDLAISAGIRALRCRCAPYRFPLGENSLQHKPGMLRTGRGTIIFPAGSVCHIYNSTPFLSFVWPSARCYSFTGSLPLTRFRIDARFKKHRFEYRFLFVWLVLLLIRVSPLRVAKRLALCTIGNP